MKALLQRGLVDWFDLEFYQQQLDAPRNVDADHFLTVGDARNADPSPYFSTAFYKSQYPDWNSSGAETALEDFLTRLQEGEARMPHPLIDPAYYQSKYPDLAELGADSMRHFICHGDAESRRPSDLFDPDFYKRCYLPDGSTHPFRHFVVTGNALGHMPRAEAWSRLDSAERMSGLITGLSRPLIFVSHNAETAGVPILTLDLADAASERGWQPVFILLRGGPLLQKFEARGPVAMLSESWDREGVIDALPCGVPAIINTSAAAELAPMLGHGKRPCLLLIHEMADYVRAQKFIAPLKLALGAGVKLIASMPVMAADLEPELGVMPVVRPGVKVLNAPLSDFRRVRQLMRPKGEKDPGFVFIGAGNADHRKGFDLFISASQRIALRAPTARFVWLGTLNEWAQGLAREALENGLDLTLPGFVNDAVAWYYAADVYLLTSRQDPGPSTVVHAAAVGTPFVGYAADIGLVGQIDRMGVFIEPGDETRFVEAALTAAAMPKQHALRRWLRAEADFNTYADAILTKLTDRQASD